MDESKFMQRLAELLADATVQSKLGQIADDLLAELGSDPARPKSTFRSIPLARCAVTRVPSTST